MKKLQLKRIFLWVVFAEMDELGLAYFLRQRTGASDYDLVGTYEHAEVKADVYRQGENLVFVKGKEITVVDEINLWRNYPKVFQYIKKI